MAHAARAPGGPAPWRRAHAIRRALHHPGALFHAILICSDGDCAELFEAYGPLEELEALACDCGCSLELLATSELDGAGRDFELTPLG